jgi:hypothetical protein
MAKGDDVRLAKRVAMNFAEHQLRDRALRTEVLYTLIGKFCTAALAARPNDRKRIIAEAMKHYRRSKRTIETALKWHRKQLRSYGAAK